MASFLNNLAEIKHQLIEQAIQQDVLKFGQFTLKSGRISPYFFNAGLFNNSQSLAILASAYASVLQDNLNAEEHVIFGPAYKGIPIVAATAVSLFLQYDKNIPWTFNRKEAKDHGEGGVLVGAPVTNKKIWILDDVVTAGTAIREVMTLLDAAGAIVEGVVVALDRQEKGAGDLSAIQELQQQYGIQVKALITLTDLMEYLKNNHQTDDYARMLAYRKQYGI